MRIAIVGAGYVGLVTGACVANLGHDVSVFDTSVEKIEVLRRGDCPIHEPGLHERIKWMSYHHVDETPDMAFDVFYIAVGTPSTVNGDVDMDYVTSAARWIAKHRVRGLTQTVIIKSTVPPFTSEMVRGIVGDGMEVVSNPEFLKEGSAIADFTYPDRVVVGTRKGKLEGSPFWVVAKEIYCGSGVPQYKFLSMTNESAELSKYAANGMLATRISFMNEMSRIARRVGADIDSVREAVGSDNRIGPGFLRAGPGWGGSCFPKDVSALARMLPDDGYGSVCSAAIAANREQQRHIVSRVSGLLSVWGNKQVCIWGVAFKPGTDDTRDSPALEIANELSATGHTVSVHDPVAKLSDEWKKERGVMQIDNMYGAAQGASIIILVTDWPHYKGADWSMVRDSMRQGGGANPTIFDTRNCLSPDVVGGYLRLERL